MQFNLLDQHPCNLPPHLQPQYNRHYLEETVQPHLLRLASDQQELRRRPQHQQLLLARLQQQFELLQLLNQPQQQFTFSPSKPLQLP